MDDDTELETDGTIPANDNQGPDGRDDETRRQLDRVVLTIARLIGRRMAREHFAALGAANDNRPTNGFWCKERKRGIVAGKRAKRRGLTGMLSIVDLFKGRHFGREIIILCVRWYLRFKLSFRDLVEMMAERGISLAHTTIMRWIQRYVPEFEKCWNRFARQAGRSWRVDETYVKIKGRWTYLYRAVDKEGKTVDFLLRAKRDVAAAKVFFRRAFKGQGRLPRAITLDGYQASHRAAREVLGEHSRGKRTKLRSSKYLNNLIEQDHRSIKLRLGPMLGFKRFERASITIAGIELMHRIRKGQFALGKLRVTGNTAPEIWTAVLAA